MPTILNIFKRNMELLSRQEQLLEISSLIKTLNYTNFNYTFYDSNRKYKIL